jgi:NADH-quinone oxidoreductase subunit H
MAPWPLSLWDGANQGWWPMLWWLLKVQIFIFVFIWLRGTLPRLRYDQFMKFGWKLLIPVSIAWIIIVAIARALRNDVDFSNQSLLLVGAAVIVLLLLISWAFQARADRQQEALDAAAEAEAAAVVDSAAGGFPVPPMPGQEFTITTRRSMAASTTIVAPRTDTEAVTSEQENPDG